MFRVWDQIFEQNIVKIDNVNKTYEEDYSKQFVGLELLIKDLYFE